MPTTVHLPSTRTAYTSRPLAKRGIGGFVLLICALFAFLSIAYVAQRKVRGTKTMWFIIAMMADHGLSVPRDFRLRLVQLPRVPPVFHYHGDHWCVSYLVMKEGKAVFD